ncbi:MAG: MlaE family lipid ABC transporter permease subunit [Xanthobacteraceae bacterium]|nr:MlaE family lipid ABC transporter permease subunit [Xanthobacteraceae bacterium]
MNDTPKLNTVFGNNEVEIRPAGSWTASQAADLEKLLERADPPAPKVKSIRLDLSGIRELDTFGAWLLERMTRRAEKSGYAVATVGVDDRFAGLIDEIHSVNRGIPVQQKRQNPILSRLDQIGRFAVGLLQELLIFLQTLGELGAVIVKVLLHPRRLRLTSLVYQTYRVGWQAIPIVVLITFLIGAIIAQQGIFHFRKFGAESYVVDMVGILVLREIGVLIVSIMVAGRSGSAYTAELGSMKMREEIDALSTMGLDPAEVLVLPRVAALVIALPILTFIGSMAALYGGGLIAWLYGGMSPAIFMARLHDAVSVTHFEVGMIKSPFMALVIGIVACSEGLRVKGSAESLGRQTTASVVKSIFLVIVLDGLFAVFFASIGM